MHTEKLRTTKEEVLKKIAWSVYEGPEEFEIIRNSFTDAGLVTEQEANRLVRKAVLLGPTQKRNLSPV